jgi:hypothetical protein
VKPEPSLGEPCLLPVANQVRRHSANPFRLQPVAGGLLLLGALVRIVGFLQNTSLSGNEALLALSIGTRSFRQLLQPLDYRHVAMVPFSGPGEPLRSPEGFLGD